MRAIWSGSVNFGLINVPVRLYSATEDHSLSFHLLHKKDLSPIRYARICLEDGQEIPYEDIVKGYEYRKGEYVVIDQEDFKKVQKGKSETISILHFAMSEEIDSIYFEKPYFLEPGKGANKTYALLLETLKVSGKVAIVKFVLRDKEHLGILKPYKNSIILVQMRFADEIRNLEDLDLPETDIVNKKEIDMSLKLVKQLTSKFDIEGYKDEHTQALKDAIEAKLNGVSLEEKAAPKRSTKIHDISALLKASLEEVEAKNKKPKRAAK